jgi:tetratricopeptide (TPR) repeat protein
MDLDSEEKQRYVHQPEAPLKERNWFERHLNWTMVLAWLGPNLVAILVVTFPEELASLGTFDLIVFLVLSISVGQWVLKKKNRSMWWLLISPTIFFLLIDNKSFMRDEYGKTMADYDKLVELDPDNAVAYCERGDFYYEMDEYDKAVTDYNKAIELAPNDANAYYNRGCAYGEMGEYDKAIADYDTAIELDPNDANTYYNRGLAYHEKGEVPKAVSDLEKCMRLSTDPELTKAAEQALRKIKNSP